MDARVLQHTRRERAAPPRPPHYSPRPQPAPPGTLKTQHARDPPRRSWCKEATLDLTWQIVEAALSPTPPPERRARVGELLLRALDADAFVSYVADPTGPFADPVAVNLSAERLRAYDTHYRHVDRLTPRLYARRDADLVSVVSLEPTTRDEFEHDFLLRANMRHGMNYFARGLGPGAIDLRIWRSPRNGPFSPEAARVLGIVGDLVQRLWVQPQLADSGGAGPAGSSAGAGRGDARASGLATPAPLALPAGDSWERLSPREREVATLVAQGLADRAICAALHIAHSTLRTHLTHAFEKTGAANRAALAALYAAYRHK